MFSFRVSHKGSCILVLLNVIIVKGLSKKTLLKTSILGHPLHSSTSWIKDQITQYFVLCCRDVRREQVRALRRLADFHEWETLTQSSGRRQASWKGYVSLNNCRKRPIEKCLSLAGHRFTPIQKLNSFVQLMVLFLHFVTLNKQGLAKTRHVVAME